jgi:hypothetical protein
MCLLNHPLPPCSGGRANAMPDAESKQPHASHGTEQSPRNSKLSEIRGIREINGQLAITRTENVLAQLRLIARENLDAFAPA